MDNKFYKALVCSNVGSFEELFQLIRENCQLLKPLYAYRAKFSGFLNYLLERTAVSQDYEKVFGITIDFLACNLVNSPEDIIDCLQNIKRNNLRILFTKELIRNPLLNKDVLISLGQDIKTFQSLPYDLGWIEVPIIQYGKMILTHNDFIFLEISSHPMSVENSLSLFLNWLRTQTTIVIQDEDGEISGW